MPPFDHPLRYATVNELHARPFPSVDLPCTAVFLAIKEPTNAANRDREADLAHLTELTRRHGAPRPEPQATHYSGHLGRAGLKWESHTEFVTYTAFSPGLSARPFDPVEATIFPADWIERAPGKRLVSALIRIAEMPEDPDDIFALCEDWFVPESMILSQVVDEAAIIAGDFRIDPAGHMRFAIFIRPGTSPRRIGRIVQRICEIETYRAVSMLGLMRARHLNDRLNALDPQMEALVAGLESDGRPSEAVLQDLLTISAELEGLAVRFSFRFGATAAYEAILNQRVQVLRETRINGRQTISEFMMRRYDPAMRTVKSAEKRLREMSERAARAAELFRTRVDVERSGQNQRLLESMDHRADQALRLQHTVEGLSVVAISYYAVSLASYLGQPFGKAVGLSKESLTAVLVLPVIGAVWLLIRRIRRKIH
ncbi:DUF3422 domain-containing protein [Xinfangfangia sp. CPCC 101601]|uniref:DUF3422 domain-containing protein n=1 Tax=Pseudogemmobacter lacusdianii TaxID=3069608 RepID=A0ABU0VZ21_9RHOB|nr:DUF3422 domain-containing protein [Xinfangfangia sp. CPCC 101601]MDQ2067001.1 DUF3422 domain-containing protein [Xinfangfangia sp. CPCC 101601]